MHRLAATDRVVHSSVHNRDTTPDDARLGHLAQQSPHRCVKSISSSGNRVLTSDILGTVALWEVGMSQRANGDDDMDGSGPGSSRMSLVTEKNLTEAASKNVIDQSGRKKEHRGTSESTASSNSLYLLLMSSFYPLKPALRQRFILMGLYLPRLEAEGV